MRIVLKSQGDMGNQSKSNEELEKELKVEGKQKEGVKLEEEGRPEEGKPEEGGSESKKLTKLKRKRITQKGSKKLTKLKRKQITH